MSKDVFGRCAVFYIKSENRSVLDGMYIGFVVHGKTNYTVYSNVIAKDRRRIFHKTNMKEFLDWTARFDVYLSDLSMFSKIICTPERIITVKNRASCPYKRIQNTLKAALMVYSDSKEKFLQEA